MTGYIINHDKLISKADLALNRKDEQAIKLGHGTSGRKLQQNRS